MPLSVCTLMHSQYSLTGSASRLLTRSPVRGGWLTRRLAEGRCVSEAEAQARAGLTAGDQCALQPGEAPAGHRAPRDPRRGRFQEATRGNEVEFPQRFCEKLFEETALLNVYSTSPARQDEPSRLTPVRGKVSRGAHCPCCPEEGCTATFMKPRSRDGCHGADTSPSQQKVSGLGRELGGHSPRTRAPP